MTSFSIILLSRAVCALLAICCVLGIEAQPSEFHIYKGEEKVGNILVDRTELDDQIRYRMDSYSEFSLIWTQEVRTSVFTEYLRGAISHCYSSIKVNGSIRDSSYMRTGSTSRDCYVHPDQAAECGPGTDWSTARMYFEEPVNARWIYVESVLKDCPLERSGPGRYTLTFPNDTRNHYVYRHGVLYEIQVIRPLFDLVFRRA